MASSVNEASISVGNRDRDKSSLYDKTWWKNGTVYQIYPSSFKDSNGDGLGDIPGTISSLDYIKSLGIDIVWLCPMYDSPQVDNGYDIADYESIYPPYGTLNDMEMLIQGCHERGMRIIIDLVINHTSDQHQWFKESRSSKDNPKRDWYIWKPAKYDEAGERQPPNNWRGFFGGSAWEWDETSDEYYLRLFAKEMPDLNWENEETRNAIYRSAMEFWLQKGVDGFRIDTINLYSKDQAYPDAPIVDHNSPWQSGIAYFVNGPRIHEYLREMYDKVLSKYDCVTVGELGGVDQAQLLQYVSAGEKQINMAFLFDVVNLGQGRNERYDTDPFQWTLPELKVAIFQSQRLIGATDAWATAFLENHDQGRSISRYACDNAEYRMRSGKMLALMLATLSGTLFIYQGQEIGMVNIPKEWPIAEYKDIYSRSSYESIEARGNKEELDRTFAAIQIFARDNARLPMQWDDSPNAGFTSGRPWMRPHDNYKELNVKNSVADDGSLLSFWKRMLRLRKEYAQLMIHGEFRTYDEQNGNVFTFTKIADSKTALVVLNFSSDRQSWEKPGDIEGSLENLASTLESSDAEDSMLSPWEGRVYLVH